MKIKLLVLFIILLSVNLPTTVQQLSDNNLKKFTESIIVNFQYPFELKRNCIPTIALLKVDLDQNGKVSNMDVSDSADMLFKINFQIASIKFDKKSLQAFAAKFSLKNTALLIPYFNRLSSKMCPSPLSPGDLNKYRNFNGIPLQGNRLYTDPLIEIGKDEYDMN